MRALLLGVAMLAACAGATDGRPGEDDARGWFEGRYPGTALSEVRISEDEVVARSFRFSYRPAAASRDTTLEVQFMEVDGRWQPRPDAPAALP
jgi:hypothetical protein